jgi:hypothetical protein
MYSLMCVAIVSVDHTVLILFADFGVYHGRFMLV